MLGEGREGEGRMKKLKLGTEYTGWMIRYKNGFSFNSLSYTRAGAWEKEMKSGWTLTKKQLVKKYGARAVKMKIIEVK